MARTVLLTLGRLPKALELARALHGAGARVLIAEPFGLHLCRPSRAVARSFRVTAPNVSRDGYLRDLRAIIEREGVEIVVPVSEEAPHVLHLREALPAHVRIHSAPMEMILRLHNKDTFITAARGMDLDVPETARADRPEVQALMAGCETISKPVHSCSGIGLTYHAQGETLAPELRSPARIVQERLHGRLLSSMTLAHEGRELGTVLYEGLVFAGTVAVTFRRVDDAPSARAWITDFVERSGYSGFVAFDMIEDALGRARAIECNPRLTSGVHFFHPDDLAACVLGPAPAAPVRLKDTTRFQEGHTALLEAYSHLLRPGTFFSRIGQVFSTRDVLWSWRDPLPFILMTPMSWDVLRKALFSSMSLGEAATADIAWHGPNPGESADAPAS